MDKLRIVLPEDVKSILVAVSGGADSVALLALLRETALERPVRLTAAHFEHGIRGEASLQDAAFVRRLCADWNVPILEGSADVPAIARRQGVGVETAAREARYAFLKEAREKAQADVIALAHHRDDQAETALMHLFRGAGLQGVSGMRERENDLFRPLLQFSKETLVSYLQERKIEWREDATNQALDTPRNGLRLQVIPEAERYYPGASQAVVRFAELASVEDDYLAKETDRFLFQDSARLPTGWLLSLKNAPHEAILRRAIRSICHAEYESIVRIARLREGTRGVLEVSGGWRAERGSEGIYMLCGRWRGLADRTLPKEGTVSLDEIGRLKVSAGTGTAIRDDRFCQELDRDALEGAVIRTRRAGDVIYPLGVGGRQKLSDYFINRRVDRPLRDLTPLIAKGNQVLWAAGVGISEEAKLKKNSKAVRLELNEWPLQKFGGKYDV